MKHSKAWALDLGAGLQAAVGDREMVHLVPSPELFDVPATPSHCRHVVIWKDEILPVVDLPAWLTGCTCQHQQSLIGIFAYQPRPGVSPRQGALLLNAIPRRLSVRDDQASALPDKPKRWREIAVSCFTTVNGVSIPIIDLTCVFTRGLLEA
jgi:chemotaxis signal transduction protein